MLRDIAVGVFVLGFALPGAIAGAADRGNCGSIPVGLSGRVEARSDAAAISYVLVLSPKSVENASELLAECADAKFSPTELVMQMVGGDEGELEKAKGRTVHAAGSLRPMDEASDGRRWRFEVTEIIRPE